jgi:hypothetical protein
MERSEFVTTEPDAWWLVEQATDARIDQARRHLGEAFGWSDPAWYTLEPKLDELYRFIESQGSQFLQSLDESTDIDKREQWLRSVLAQRESIAGEKAKAAKSVAPSGDSAIATRTAQPAPASKPERKSAFGQKKDSSERAAEPAPASKPERSSPFGHGKERPSPAAEAVAEPAADSGQISPGPAMTPEVAVAAASETISEFSAGKELEDLATELGVSIDDIKAVLAEDDFQADLVSALTAQEAG